MNQENPLMHYRILWGLGLLWRMSSGVVLYVEDFKDCDETNPFSLRCRRSVQESLRTWTDTGTGERQVVRTITDSYETGDRFEALQVSYLGNSTSNAFITLGYESISVDFVFARNNAIGGTPFRQKCFLQYKVGHGPFTDLVDLGDVNYNEANCPAPRYTCGSQCEVDHFSVLVPEMTNQADVFFRFASNPEDEIGCCYLAELRVTGISMVLNATNQSSTPVPLMQPTLSPSLKPDSFKSQAAPWKLTLSDIISICSVLALILVLAFLAARRRFRRIKTRGDHVEQGVTSESDPDGLLLKLKQKTATKLLLLHEITINRVLKCRSYCKGVGKNSIFLSYRGRSSETNNHIPVLTLKRQIDSFLGKDAAFMADQKISDKKSIIPTLKAAQKFVIVLTPEYFQSTWCVAEYIIAVQEGKQVGVVFWNHEHSSKQVSLKILESYTVIDWFPQLLDFDEEFCLTVKGRREAAEMLKDVIHMPIRLDSLEDQKASVQRLLRKGLGYKI